MSSSYSLTIETESSSSTIETDNRKSHRVGLKKVFIVLVVLCYYAFFIFLAIFVDNKVKDEDDKVGDVLCTIYVNITCSSTELCVERHMMWYKINDKLYRKVLHETTCLSGACPTYEPKIKVCYYFIDTPSIPYEDSKPETTKKTRYKLLFIFILSFVIAPAFFGFFFLGIGACD